MRSRISPEVLPVFELAKRVSEGQGARRAAQRNTVLLAAVAKQ